MGDASEVVREVGVNDFRVATEQQPFHLDHRLLGIAPGRYAYCSGGRSASKIGASTSIAAVMQTRSRRVEMPSGLSCCFRLERLPGGPCTHWKAPPLHGARHKPTFTPSLARDSTALPSPGPWRS